ncbi:O-antigen ligase family protein [Stutzerimonas stutzeri]|uniref:O-antigen ligase family protein n=1 Tax=Stutzerimonas stutzeri TaxID=316 RepID=UPI000D0AF6BE|nr:O-antigen ligase family protein [Stutzerimonas stutzeri]AWK99233.1 O-antigen ligase domain-containing protein [Stutzerimonas stutzeri]MDH0122134.1 O-antigen ligase family protein [Stutzerimonas stutzeri]MPS56164.1 O-antigen ligase domain-containing protein [Pseudomonas sp.]MTI90932.1 O-antigen ligase family protein [Stutzerimonas stutzeri]
MTVVQRLKGLEGRFGYFTPALLLFIVSFLLLPTSKMVNNVYYVLLALPALGVLLLRRGRGIQQSVALWLWVALCAWFVVVGALSADGQYFKHVLYMVLFVLVVSQLVDPEPLRMPLFSRGLFWILGVYVLGSAVVYWLTGRYAFGERVLWLPGRMTGPIYTSMWLACCFALALPTWLSQRRWLELSAAALLAVFCMAYVLQSRSGLIGMLLIGGLVGGWLALHRARYLLWLGFVCALLAMLTLFVTREVPEVASLFARADAGRFELWRILAGEWLECGLWLGCGMQHSTEATIGGGAPIQHPHNIYLALGLYSGLVSLLLFLALVVVVLQRAWQQRDPWGLYLFTALVVLNFDGSKLVGNPDELWLLVLLPMALIINQRAGAPG